MDSQDFSAIRKKLNKTQRETANLLGISLKAVSSYEQGWRPIPSHVERQLLYLLSKKIAHPLPDTNCWELRHCPEEKKNKCPAWEFDSGQLCWFICGTLCENTDHTTWDKKMAMCRTCEMLKNIRA